MKKLYVFPVRYPYTENIECFLNDEIPFLAKKFDEVILVPLKKEIQDSKALPCNCSYKEPIFANKISFFYHGLFCARTFMMLMTDLYQNKAFCDLKKLRIWVIGYFTINNIFNSKTIKEIEQDLTKNDVCYFYWGKWSNILSYFWHFKVNCISRFHGWGDLWEDDYNNYFPLREKVVKSLIYAVQISSIGEKYFKAKYPDSKTLVCRLGSFDCGMRSMSELKTINVVSCSSLWPLKRVDLILHSIELLASMTSNKIKWTHIGGDGNELVHLKRLVNQNSCKNLFINIIGSMPHKKVMEYYASHSADIFVNLSTTEGVPVSIMEAISFDIPAVATNVGGTSDVVVNGVSGILVPNNPSTKEVADAIISIYNNSKLYSPRLFWNKYFNANKNYAHFADLLSNL